MTVKKLDGIPVRLPASGDWPAQDVFVNFRCVASTNVDRVGWDDAGNMYVQYRRGSMYVYPGVSRQQAVAAAYAESVGSYIAYRIKPKFQAIQLD